MDTDALAYFTEYCESRYSQQSTIATLKRLGYFDVVGDVSILPLGSVKKDSHSWGGLPFWTGFVERMWKALDRCDIPQRFCCRGGFFGFVGQ